VFVPISRSWMFDPQRRSNIEERAEGARRGLIFQRGDAALLSNVVLHELEEELERRGLSSHHWNGGRMPDTVAGGKPR